MSSESESGSNTEERRGPQGTQMFSSDPLPGHLDMTGGDVTLTGREVRLIGNSDTLDGKEFMLVSDRTTIGRSQVCDIRIDEPSLSSEHARLVRSEDGWRVINLLSTNGVFVNDEKVFSHRLNDGDVIRLGRISLKFRDPNSEAVDAGTSSRFSTGMAIGFIAALVGAAAGFFLLR